MRFGLVSDQGVDEFMRHRVLIKSTLFRYYSDIIFDGNNTGDQKLDCMWIDADGDQPYTGFQVYWPAYAADPPIKSKDLYALFFQIYKF